MVDLEQTNETRSMMKGTYNDTKLDKSSELNERMTISQSSRDDFESTIHSIGGTSNGS